PPAARVRGAVSWPRTAARPTAPKPPPIRRSICRREHRPSIASYRMAVSPKLPGLANPPAPRDSSTGAGQPLRSIHKQELIRAEEHLGVFFPPGGGVRFGIALLVPGAQELAGPLHFAPAGGAPVDLHEGQADPVVVGGGGSRPEPSGERLRLALHEV